MKNILAFLFGALFAVGLMLSGMSNPEKVLNFLDVFGHWDASLIFVMLGAITVALIPFQKVVRNQTSKTIFNEPIHLPKNNKVDAQLILGSMLFGIGWGIAGVCPAPSFTLIGLGHYSVMYFIVAMVAGMLIHRKWAGDE